MYKLFPLYPYVFGLLLNNRRGKRNIQVRSPSSRGGGIAPTRGVVPLLEVKTVLSFEDQRSRRLAHLRRSGEYANRTETWADMEKGECFFGNWGGRGVGASER